MGINNLTACRINKLHGISYAIHVLSNTIVFLHQWVLLHPRHSIRIVEPRAEIEIGGGQQVLPVGVLFRRRCIGCRTSAYQVVPTPCRRDSNPSGRGLVCRLMLPSPPRAYCPDDPSGNSAPRNSRRCSSQRYGLRRTTRSRTCLPFRSPTNIPKNPHTDNLGFHNHRRYFSLPSARYK